MGVLSVVIGQISKNNDNGVFSDKSKKEAKISIDADEDIRIVKVDFLFPETSSNISMVGTAEEVNLL